MESSNVAYFFCSVLRVQSTFKSECDYVLAKKVGVDYELVPPVPIPNTVVKQLHADNTWLATAREDT